jgi:hypothetical protein
MADRSGNTRRDGNSGQKTRQEIRNRIGELAPDWLFPAVKRVGVWGITAILANAFAILAIVVALRVDQREEPAPTTTVTTTVTSLKPSEATGQGPADQEDRGLEALPYFFASGNAATMAIGLAAGALAELYVKGGNVGRLHMWISTIAVGAIIVTAVAYPDVVAGRAGLEKAQRISVLMLISAVALGAIIAAITSARAMTQSD